MALDFSEDTVRVIVLHTGDGEALTRTLLSLRQAEFALEQTTVISPAPLQQACGCCVISEHADFFDIFSSLEKEIQKNVKKDIMILRSGVLSPTNFSCSQNLFSFYIQERIPLQRQLELFEVLQEPRFPLICYLPKTLLQAGVSYRSSLLHFGFYELILQAIKKGFPVESNPYLEKMEQPLPQIVDCYYRHLGEEEGKDTGEFPPSFDELYKLETTLFGQIFELHQEAFQQHASGLLPALFSKNGYLENHYAMLHQQKTQLEEAHNSLQQSFKLQPWTSRLPGGAFYRNLWRKLHL